MFIIVIKNCPRNLRLIRTIFLDILDFKVIIFVVILPLKTQFFMSQIAVQGKQKTLTKFNTKQ